MIRSSFFIALILLILLGLACKTEKKEKFQILRSRELAIKNKVHNQLLDVEKEQGWRLLFDGETLDGWHLYNNADSTGFSAWEVREGTLFCNAKDETKIFGDLVTNSEFEDYELVFEWQMALRGNGGVFINVQESVEYVATHRTGPEYQLLEPLHMDNDIPLKRPGCLWGISPQLNQVEAKPAGQWNKARIVQKEGKIEFYLNGKLTAKEDFTSKGWRNKIASSGFKNMPGFGTATRGRIALQNWYFEASFRNMKILEL